MSSDDINDFIFSFTKMCASTKYSFEQRLASFLKYIKAKQIDETSVIIGKEYLQKEQVVSNEHLASIENAINISMKEKDFSTLSQHSLIIDLCGFVHTKSDFEAQTFDFEDRLTCLLSKLKNLGSLVILADFPTCTFLESFLLETFEKEAFTNYLIKASIYHKTPFLSFIAFQRFNLKSPVVPANSKIHLTEAFVSDNKFEINKIGDLTLSEFKRTYVYLFTIQEISVKLKSVSHYIKI